MHEIGAFEAKNKLGTLLDWVENGEEVLITRRGKAVARLVPAEPGFDRAKARRAADGLLGFGGCVPFRRGRGVGSKAPQSGALQIADESRSSELRFRS